jgi:hypothetical protein
LYVRVLDNHEWEGVLWLFILGLWAFLLLGIIQTLVDSCQFFMDGLFECQELVVIFSRSPAHFALQERINLLRSLLHLRPRLAHIGLRIAAAADFLQLGDHIGLRQLSVLAFDAAEEFLRV